MESQFAKVLDSDFHDVMDLKRKRTVRCGMYSSGHSHTAFPLRVTPSSSACYSGKRRKMGGSSRVCGGGNLSSGKKLLKYYTNLKKTGHLQRLMYYHDGEWVDFPQDTVSGLNNDLLARKTAAEVDFEGNKILLDFLHMMKLDFGTGLCQPIAWIDVSGSCFFPEIIGDYDEARECHFECAEDEQHPAFEPLGFKDINLHLEVEITGLDAFKLKESTGESSDISNLAHFHENSGGKDGEDEVNDSYVRGPTARSYEKCAWVSNTGENVDLTQRFLNVDALKKLFLKGMEPSAVAEIVEIIGCSSTAMEARHELFEKQVEITKRFRGNANVVYAWLPCSGISVHSILKYGVGSNGSCGIEPLHGLGTYLIPANGTTISGSYCDVDENETRHLVFCRVIMGNMELVPHGSNQFHPSKEDYDSGVDNLQNPKHYVVWDVNVNSHIYPEYVVSFKMASAKGALHGKVCETNVLGITTGFKGSTVQGNHGSLAATDLKQARSPLMRSTDRTPSSPHMPFSELLTALSRKVPAIKMNLINTYYELYMNKKITRDGFVKKLRFFVGDALLKATIISLRSNGRPKDLGGSCVV